MLFNSAPFLLFLAVVLCIYYPLPHRAQNAFLLVASLFFYACWDWRFLGPLLFTTSLDYFCARRMEDLIACGRPRSARRPWLLLSVICNLGLLAFFKYAGFFAASLGAEGIFPRVVLPLGISFYTFQALSYTIDVYRGELHATRSYPDFLLAVVYFAHLVAGPIQRAHNLLPQIANPRRVSSAQVVEGIHLVVWGYFKKVFIADNLAPHVDRLFSLQHPAGSQVVLAAWLFAIQIYCDFSGYTDIARGIAKLMGFEFMHNFCAPYLAAGPREFWSRWHISLSTWLRDYLYIPLGGSRHGTARTCINIMITMALGGLWHGANWTFVVWGVYHGGLLLLGRAVQPAEQVFPRWLRAILFFQLTCYGWLIFRAESLHQVWTMTRVLFAPLGPFDPAVLHTLPGVALAVLVAWIARAAARHAGSIEARTACYAAILYLTLFRGGSPQSFIYFRF